MALDIVLLRSSFALVVEREPELTRRFYSTLFTRYPELKPLFRAGRERQQEQMLRDALVAVMDHLDDAPWLTEQLGALGGKHVDYGVKEEMYAAVGDALLTTLAIVAADEWTAELRVAWSDAYAAIAGLMQKGATAALAAAPPT